MRPSFVAQVTAYTLGAATATALIRVNAGTDRPVEISELGVSFEGIVNTDEPVKVELLRFTDNGTMDSLTPVKQNDSLAEGIGATAAQAQSTPTNPTAGDVLRTWYVHPQGLPFAVVFPHDGRPVIGGGDRAGLRVTANDAVDVSAYIVGIE